MLTASGVSFAFFHEDGESVKIISAQDIKEKLDGKDTKVTVVEVTIGPGESGLPHRHPGQGSCMCWKVNTSWASMTNRRRFKAGETFYEPTGCLHRVSKNPATRARLASSPSCCTARCEGSRHPRAGKKYAPTVVTSE